MAGSPGPDAGDVRMRGFPRRVEVAAVQDLVDACCRALPSEAVPVTACATMT